jgi:urease accessory protein
MSTAVLALLLADGRTPTGGYAHSGGLEAAVKDGLSPAAVPAFMRGRLHTTAVCEAAFASAATRAADDDDPDELALLDREMRARTSSPPLRDASTRLGSSLLRTASRMFGAPPVLERYRQDSESTPRPVSLGVVAAAAGLSPLDCATISLYADATGVASAAVKLLAIDAAGAFGWVAALAGEIERLAAAASRRVPASQLPSASATLVDLRSLLHELDGARLFAS